MAQALEEAANLLSFEGFSIHNLIDFALVIEGDLDVGLTDGWALLNVA